MKRQLLGLLLLLLLAMLASATLNPFGWTQQGQQQRLSAFASAASASLTQGQQGLSASSSRVLKAFGWGREQPAAMTPSVECDPVEEPETPIVLFHGRRGVGKSRLIEQLAGFENGALTSGPTSTARILPLGLEHTLAIDTPGLGSDTAAAFDQVMQHIRHGRVKRVYLVVDPTSVSNLRAVPHDCGLLQLAYGTQIAVVLVVNKMDLVSGDEDLEGALRPIAAGLRTLYVSAAAPQGCAPLHGDIVAAAHDDAVRIQFVPPFQWSLGRYAEPLGDLTPTLPETFTSLGQFVATVTRLSDEYELRLTALEKAAAKAGKVAAAGNVSAILTGLAGLPFPPLMALSAALGASCVYETQVVTDLSDEMAKLHRFANDLKTLKRHLQSRLR